MHPLLTSLRGKKAAVIAKVFGERLSLAAQRPSRFVKQAWQAYTHSGLGSNSLNGAIFEYLIAFCLYERHIRPFYQQARLGLVPNVAYDLVLYTKAAYPITLSLKTSLRERYKQADLEGWALKNVHRKAKNYLLTLSNEVVGVQQKIAEGAIAGLDAAILVTSEAFDTLLEELQATALQQAQQIPLIEAGHLVA